MTEEENVTCLSARGNPYCSNLPQILVVVVVRRCVAAGGGGGGVSRFYWFY